MVNWDEALSYNTIKFVTIRDRRLGFLHYFFMFAIILYVFLYAVWWNQGYLRKETPFGAVRATLRQPAFLPNLEDIPYCGQNQSTFHEWNNLDCIYLGGNNIGFPTGLTNPIFITSRTKITTRPAPTSPCNPPTSVDCVFSDSANNTSTSRYYIAGIEDYTIFIDHLAYGLTNDFVERSVQMKGEVYNHKGKKQYLLDSERPGDIFTVRELLNLAGISSLEDPSSVSNNPLRYDGVQLLITIEYFNRASKPKELKYKLRVRKVDGVDTARFDADTLTTSSNRHGIAISFIQTGWIGTFDFPTLLSAIIGGAVLTGISTKIVDFILLYLLPEKKIYNDEKYQKTEAYSDIKKHDAKEMSSLS